MKLNTIITVVIILIGFTGLAQIDIKTDSKEFQLGDGLRFNVNDGEYKFNINGFIQGALKHEKMDGSDATNYMNTKNTYLSISGSMYKEKVSFLLQNNFSNAKPLLDAWIAYTPISSLKISFGQKQTFTNNREMTFYEDKLQFIDRGIFSSEFSNSGREFGVFFESQLGKNTFVIKPKFAVTSGDGINSFGANSTDVDKGGLKYGGRIDILPTGNFKAGNDGYIADLLHEEKIKILVGAAFSYNKGASNKVGEGHGDFVFYDNNLKEKLPDFRKSYCDILIKYKGFSFLGEYVNSSALSLEGSFLNPTATAPLFMTEISNYLVLGNGYNIQGGYVTKSGLSLDFKYEKLTKEFNNNYSLLSNQDAFTIGFTKYIKGNNLKIQSSVTSTNLDQFNAPLNTIEKRQKVTAQFSFQVVF
ncbi:hypothetical protein [Flavobacterium sp.]|uniref:hypothetical protein n=1 Tax=Flavobacterium sp. TaxID=239 RepID=UPI003BF4832D